jgi:flagellar export protein FliJ
MESDPLLALLRLRRLATDEARRVLAECLHAETEAAGRIRAVELAIAQETETASRLDGDHRMVEEFGSWLRCARAERQSAEADLTLARAQTGEARAVLGASRAALRAVEELLAKRAAEHRAEMQRAEQQSLDELGAR